MEQSHCHKPRSSSKNLDILFRTSNLFLLSFPQNISGVFTYYICFQTLPYLFGQLTQFCASFHIKPSLRILLVGGWGGGWGSCRRNPKVISSDLVQRAQLIIENVFDVEHLTSSKDLHIGLHETCYCYRYLYTHSIFSSLSELRSVFRSLIDVRLKRKWNETQPTCGKSKSSYRIISVDIPLCRVWKELGLFTEKNSIRITVYRFSSNSVKLLELLR